MNALLFPGQGVQKVGMLNEIFDIEDETKEFIKSAANDLDFDLVELIKSGPEEKLNLTEFAQPAILAASIAITKLKKLNNKNRLYGWAVFGRIFCLGVRRLP